MHVAVWEECYFRCWMQILVASAYFGGLWVSFLRHEVIHLACLGTSVAVAESNALSWERTLITFY
jgi:hypothetical protein